MLHPDERNLRCLATQGLHDIHAEKLARWRQCFHTRVAMEWDENSRFFHAAASGRRWRNNIAVLEGDGIVATTHSAKHTILHNFYLDLLGRSRGTSWNFALADLYPSLDLASCDLSAPFSASEITTALFAMDMHASPGPDGFGPPFTNISGHCSGRTFSYYSMTFTVCALTSTRSIVPYLYYSLRRPVRALRTLSVPSLFRTVP